MRVLFCKIHCPSFICFCKSTSHIYKPGPLKLENSQYLSSTTVVSVSDVDHENSEVKEESFIDGKKQQKQGEEAEQQQQQQEQQEAGENCVESSLKRENSKEVQSKKVQWMDFLGKELVEIREFEASETEDIDNDSEFSEGCVCTIL